MDKLTKTNQKIADVFGKNGDDKLILLIRNLPTWYDPKAKTDRIILYVPIPKLSRQILEKQWSGRDAREIALKIAAKFGGQTIYVPTRSEPNDLLKKELGEEDAKSLVLRLGGQTLAIPEPLDPNCETVKILGKDDALKLAAAFPGETLNPEKCMPSNYLSFRNQAIIRMVLEGTHIKIVAGMFDLDRKTIENIMRDIPEDEKSSMSKMRYKEIKNDKGDIVGWKPY